MDPEWLYCDVGPLEDFGVSFSRVPQTGSKNCKQTSEDDQHPVVIGHDRERDGSNAVKIASHVFRHASARPVVYSPETKQGAIGFIYGSCCRYTAVYR